MPIKQSTCKHLFYKPVPAYLSILGWPAKDILHSLIYKLSTLSFCPNQDHKDPVSRITKTLYQVAVFQWSSPHVR